MFTVSVKWKKEVFSNVEIDTTRPPSEFKCKLCELTGVPPERQKIMVKGGLLKDGVDWSNVEVRQGQKLMMMGTADEIVKAPEKNPIFIEDLPEGQQGNRLSKIFSPSRFAVIDAAWECVEKIMLQPREFGPEMTNELLRLTKLKQELDYWKHRCEEQEKMRIELIIENTKLTQEIDHMNQQLASANDELRSLEQQMETTNNQLVAIRRENEILRNKLEAERRLLLERKEQQRKKKKRKPVVEEKTTKEDASNIE